MDRKFLTVLLATTLASLAAGAPQQAAESRPAATQSGAAAPTPPVQTQATPPPPAKDLTLDDVFTLSERLVKKPLEQVRAWMDGQHLLTFGEGQVGEARVRGYFRLDVTSGERQLLLDPNKVAEALARLPGFPRRDADRVAATAAGWQWNKHWSAVLFAAADDLFAYDLAKGVVQRLSNDAPAEDGEQWSPDGRLVAFVREFNLHVVGADGTGARALTGDGHAQLLHGRLDWIYQEELYGRGNFQGFWWSPDSSMLAFLRLDQRPVKEFPLVQDGPTYPEMELTDYPKAGAPNPVAALGVVDVRGGAPRWFDLSRYGGNDLLIVRVQWHPDASEVYFQVQDREQRWLDLLAGDPRNGRVRLVLREQSPSWIEADGEPTWLDGGKSFLWLSERDGWKHLYHYQRDGKLVGRITEGSFEVDEVAGVDEQARLVYFRTDRSDVKEDHLWRVGLDGKGAAAVTQEPGVHRVRLAPDAALFVDTWNSVKPPLPLRVDVKRMDNGVVRTLADSDVAPLAEYQLAVPEFVQVPTRDGFAMEAMLLKPRGFQEGRRYPVFGFHYAGPHAPQVRNQWGRRYLASNHLWFQMLAQKGYLVWVCDNRSASGKGQVSAAAAWRKLGETELHDLEDGVAWLVQKGLADPERVGMFGWSYGGYQTLYNLTNSKVWKLGIAVNPVTDWHFYDSIYTERVMGLPANNPEGYRRSSVLTHAANLHGKLLLVHATMDDNVHLQNSLQLVQALQGAGKQFQFMVYPRVRHGIENDRQQRHLYQLMTEFVLANL
ncbi:MAG: S9 family peptidase [Planctomycetes bacterium]|nr:S9 family peptidase [Planctomycetota bacterium]